MCTKYVWLTPALGRFPSFFPARAAGVLLYYILACVLFACGQEMGNFFKTLFVPRVKEGPLSVPSFYFMYSIWQDVGIRTGVATTAASQ